MPTPAPIDPGSSSVFRPQMVHRAIRVNRMADFTTVQPQPDHTIKVVFEPGVSTHFDFAVRALKDCLASMGAVLGPDDEDGNFVITSRIPPPTPLPSGLLDDEPPAVQG